MKLNTNGSITFELTDLLEDNFERLMQECTTNDDRLKVFRGLRAALANEQERWNALTDEQLGYRPDKVRTPEEIENDRNLMAAVLFMEKRKLEEKQRAIQFPEGKGKRAHIQNKRDFVRVLTALQDTGILSATLNNSDLAALFFDGDTEYLRTAKESVQAQKASSAEYYNLLQMLFANLPEAKQRRFIDEGLEAQDKALKSHTKKNARNPQQPKRKD